MEFVLEPPQVKMENWVNENVSDKPIVMVNLLRFRDEADYSQTDLVAESCTGKKAYGRYSKAVMPLLLEVGGTPIWMGDARSTVISPELEQWDQVVLVSYPSRKAFVKMVTSQAYADIKGHRYAALLDSRLIETQPKLFPKRIVKMIGLGFRLKGLIAPAV